MVKIPETYNVGDRDNITQERLLELLEDMYTQLAVAINQKPAIYTRNVSGTPTAASAADDFVSIGDINIKTDTGDVEIATQHDTSSTVVWTTL